MSDTSTDADHVEVDEYVDAPPTEAFEYLTDPERRPFGNDELELGDEIRRDPPSRIAWQITTADGESRRAGTVEIAITPEGAGSRVRVIHEIGAQVVSPELALAS